MPEAPRTQYNIAMIDPAPGPPEPPDAAASGPASPADHGTPTTPPPDPSAGRKILFEITAVLCFAALPDLYIGIDAIASRTPYDDQPLDQASSFAYLIVRSLTVCVPLLLIMSRTGLPWRHFGFVPVRPVRDFALAVPLTVGAYFLASGAADVVASCIGLLPVDADTIYGVTTGEGPTAFPSLLGLVGMISAYLANSLAEEFAMRAYLCTRLIDLTGSRAIAIVGSSFVFGAYHIYGGIYHAGWAFGFGLAFAGAFLLLRTIWPLVIAHTLANLAVEAMNWWSWHHP